MSHHKADMPSETVVIPSAAAVTEMEPGKCFNKPDLWRVVFQELKENGELASVLRGEN